MQIVRVSVETNERLVDSLSDFLVGVMGMAVEFQVDKGGALTVIHGFLTVESCLESELTVLVSKVKSFALEMAEVFGVAVPKISVEKIPDQDWSKNWKLHFKPFELISGLVVAPSWEEFSPLPEQMVIVMDPGMAFGTGHHETTRLCLKMIKSSADVYRDKTVLDVGTGTGILGMAAALWGASEVTGIDNDPEAVRVAEENILRNKLNTFVKISGVAVDELNKKFPLVVANIIHDTLIDLAPGLYMAVENGGILILSGLVYGDQTKNIIDYFKLEGLTLLEEQQEGEWGAVKFTKMG